MGRCAGETLGILSPMVTGIKRGEVQRLLAKGAQLVEVLPAEDYAWLHISGAINLPLKELGKLAGAALDRERPVIVYCHEFT